MKQQAGFTLVELVVAMAIFSFVLLIVTAGFIHIVRIQQSGVASRATQQNARMILDSIMKDVRISAKVSATGTTLCLARSTTTLQYALDGAGDVWVGTVSNSDFAACSPPSINGTWRKLNDSNVQVTRFNATATQAVDPGMGTAMVTITVASRNNLNALDATRTRCQPGPGSQFCAVTTLSSGAALRGGIGG